MVSFLGVHLSCSVSERGDTKERETIYVSILVASVFCGHGDCSGCRFGAIAMDRNVEVTTETIVQVRCIRGI